VESVGRIGNVSAALLLGGASRRMGRDKAQLAFEGVAFATRSARLLERLFEEVLLVGGDAPSDAPGRRVPDPSGPRCALRGLVAALEAASAERVLVLATDLPLVTPDLLLGLVAWPEADVVLPRDREGPQPLCAVYRRAAALPLARQRLASGDLALQRVLEGLELAALEGDALRALDPEGLALSNVNTPEDLARVRALAADAAREAPRA